MAKTSLTSNSGEIVVFFVVVVVTFFFNPELFSDFIPTIFSEK